MTHRRLTRASVAVLLWAAASPAWPQSGSAAPPSTDVQGQGSLSKKLSTTNGVIHPDTDVDPSMHQQPPDAGTARTPVIPPPGTPGNDTTVQPK